MEAYNPAAVEAAWGDWWEAKGFYRANAEKAGSLEHMKVCYGHTTTKRNRRLFGARLDLLYRGHYRTLSAYGRQRSVVVTRN